jgi:hypothetical protein
MLRYRFVYTRRIQRIVHRTALILLLMAYFGVLIFIRFGPLLVVDRTNQFLLNRLHIPADVLPVANWIIIVASLVAMFIIMKKKR